VGKPEAKRPLRRPRCRWEDIMIDVKEVELAGGGIDFIDLLQDRGMWKALVNTVIKPSVCIKCGEFLD
jgi:hypothetical protein